MTSGGNGDNRAHRARVQHERMGEGQCVHCPPHRGENYGVHGRRHGRWMNGQFVPSKSKEKK